MATLYQTTGRTREMRPANGVFWTYEEKRDLVGGIFETVCTVDGRFMVINDTAKLKGLELNYPATRLYIHGRKDVIQGDALVIDTQTELEGPDDGEKSCPAMGTGGVHTDSYYDGGGCALCGATGYKDEEEED